ncbi:MAG TPA: glycerol-3-phosphate 1-O-acyltransferase PlsY [Dehalococcoidia bacterium]|nr:glycerol-3-phosphate 1-O-acyltransferase PlsY [Dehalococcoidia bacterium]
MIEFAAVVVGSYLIGSIPFGLVLGRLKGVDVRAYGSGKTGTTNVLRTLGTRYAALALAGDIIKGVAAILLARYILESHTGEMAAGFAAIAGHDWSIFIKFGGGRGVATSGGALFAMAMPAPMVAVACIGFFILVVALSRYASLGSLLGSLGAVAMMGAFLALDWVPWQYLVYVGVAVALIVFQHRDNITRLLSGKESKVGEKGQKRESGAHDE